MPAGSGRPPVRGSRPMPLSALPMADTSRRIVLVHSFRATGPAYCQGRSSRDDASSETERTTPLLIKTTHPPTKLAAMPPKRVRLLPRIGAVQGRVEVPDVHHGVVSQFELGD